MGKMPGMAWWCTGQLLIMVLFDGDAVSVVGKTLNTTASWHLRKQDSFRDKHRPAMIGIADEWCMYGKALGVLETFKFREQTIGEEGRPCNQ